MNFLSPKWQLKMAILWYSLKKLFGKGDVQCAVDGCNRRAGNIMDFVRYGWARLRKKPFRWAIMVPVPPPIQPGEPEHITLCPVHREEVFNTILSDRIKADLIEEAADRFYTKKGDKDEIN